MEYYKMKIAGLERSLPLCPLNDKLDIAGFVMFGDTELTEACAKELIKRAPEQVCARRVDSRSASPCLAAPPTSVQYEHRSHTTQQAHAGEKSLRGGWGSPP